MRPGRGDFIPETISGPCSEQSHCRQCRGTGDLSELF
jgi:hypothetical protein